VEEKVDQILWVSLILVVSWASLPAVLIYANAVFDRDVEREGHHH